MDHQEQSNSMTTMSFHDIPLSSPSKMHQSITSLNSPVDSGVQLLDSESDQTSVMSSSGCDLDMDVKLPSDQITRITIEPSDEDKLLMTKSDIANQNITDLNDVALVHTLSSQCAALETSLKEDIMNISLNSYELLDYTIANSKLRVDLEDQMHVSLSEEVNEHIPWKEPAKHEEIQMENPILSAETCKPLLPENIIEDKPIEEQIVFRRQRKKKSRNDTPKKRVSFHEDILNSTKIDDIRINHGFITIEPECSTNFLLRGFKKKHDIVQGRYSWAAEGDYNENTPICNREVQSDIFVERHCSVSSSSSSSIDEEPETKLKKPKSSCLKKTTHRPIIDTKIVDETEVNRRRSETNLLDSNIFGSLKSMFSTSLPMTERGVPEGQEDLMIYSSSEVSRGIDTSSLKPKSADVQIDAAKNNLKLRIQPMYQSDLPENVILCDSNVYEHKGISYSYEYGNFTKDFEENHKKPKNSSIYQKILKEFNFFRKRAAREQDGMKENEDYSMIRDSFDDAKIRKNDAISTATTPGAIECSVNDECESNSLTTDSECLGQNKYFRNVNLEWSDTESFSNDSLTTSMNMRHLNSPRKKISRSNHYTTPPPPLKAESLSNSKNSRLNGVVAASSSKSSLINRFLRHVTSNKMIESKSAKKFSQNSKELGIGLPSPRSLSPQIVLSNHTINAQIFAVVQKGRQQINKKESNEMRTQYKLLLDNLNDYVVSAMFSITSAQKSLVLVITQSTLFVYAEKIVEKPMIALPYQLLNAIIIGASMRTIYLSTYNNNEQFMFTSKCRDATNEIMVQLEVAMRRCKECIILPAVKQLHMSDMKYLRKMLSSQTPVEEDDECLYYTILNAQEYQADHVESHFGPNKEGPLMFKLSENESRWETAYFILKAGILYMLASPSNPEPMKVFPLLNGACHGAARVQNFVRPHTFQLILAGNVLFLAAPDEYVASDWLQALIHAASGIGCNKTHEFPPESSLLMTREQILLVREAFSCSFWKDEDKDGAQVLSYAAINDLTAFKLPSDEQCWCILEFACREVRETSGDLILYFTTNEELEDFISLFEKLWIYNHKGESFPLTTLSENDDVNKKCIEVNAVLQKVWV